MLRETRGARGRMLYLTACIATGVAAVVGTAALSESIERGFRDRSRAMMGGDLRVEARRPLPPELDALLAGVPELARTDLIETPTMVAAARGDTPRARMALLLALDGPYPLAGTLTTEPAGGLAAHLGPDGVVVASELARELEISPGDTLALGGRDFRVAAVTVDEPARLGFAAFLGPRVYLTREAFERTDLLGFGSRLEHRALVAFSGLAPRETVEALAERIESEVPDAAWLDVDHHFEDGPAGLRAVERVERYVGLVALLALVIGGVGVARIVELWVAGRAPAIAVMRCLGMEPGQILVLALGHTACLALAGSAVGAVLGALVPVALTAWAPELLPEGTAAVVPLAAVARGLGIGVALALLFALPPLTAIWRVSPARVLRAEVEPLPPNRVALAAARAVLVLGLAGAAWAQSGEWTHALAFTGGLLVLVGGLHLAAGALVRAAGRLPRRSLSPYLVHGVAALARPGSATRGAIVALGLGTMAVTGAWLVEARLEEGLLAQVPRNAPTVFLVDIRPEQRERLRAELGEAGATAVDEVPVVMARIARIDGRDVGELARAAADDDGRSRRFLTREQRLTWRTALPADNVLVAGRLWADDALDEVSVEEDYARRLGIELGSVLDFDVQGVPVRLHVTSLRSVEWKSFAINFFLVVEPGVLDRAPALHLANARVPEEAEQRLADRVAAELPGVTVLRVRPLLRQAAELLGQLAAGLRWLGAFTVLAGVAVLAGAVSASALERAREVALLKTLGITRGGIATLFVTEHGLAGAVAGALGATGALALAYGYLAFVAEVPVELPVAAVPVAAAGCALLTALAGLAASARALSVRPVDVLRG